MNNRNRVVNNRNSLFNEVFFTSFFGFFFFCDRLFVGER
jgi:hypothetical protein